MFPSSKKKNTEKLLKTQIESSLLVSSLDEIPAKRHRYIMYHTLIIIFLYSIMKNFKY